MTDVTDPAASHGRRRGGGRSFGRLDFVMLNAGIGLLEGPLERIPLEVYRQMVAVNIDGVFFGLQAAVPALRRAGRRLHRRDRLARRARAHAPDPGLRPDQARRRRAGALGGDSPAEQGITLAAIAPGFADTAIIARDLHKFQEANFPLLTAEEVAAVVLKAVEGRPARCGRSSRAGRPSRTRSAAFPGRAPRASPASCRRACSNERRDGSDHRDRRGSAPRRAARDRRPLPGRVLGDAAWSDVRGRAGRGRQEQPDLRRLAARPGEVVLRRPPLAAVLPTAHDMVREHRVISALADTDVPVPPVVPPLHRHRRSSALRST